ncbi:MAG: hypothetical protein Q4F78_07165 [Bacillota bacterium]|nr:hypothetical protein [Bacillota bacterium]
MIPKELLQKYSMADKEFYDDNMLFYQTFLVQTDHIPLKIFESFIESMATASLAETFVVVLKFFRDVKITYAEVLAARKTAREEINRIESEMATK